MLNIESTPIGYGSNTIDPRGVYSKKYELGGAVKEHRR